MELHEIKILIDRFMLGESTEKEEELLAEYFREAKDIPAEWGAYAAMFRAFDNGEPSFSEAELDSFATETIDIATESAAKTKRTRKRIVLFRWAAAASVALIIGIAAMWSLSQTEDSHHRSNLFALIRQSYSKKAKRLKERIQRI